MQRFLLISLGAVIGANARYLVALWLDQTFVTRFPLATFVVNVTGSALLGFFLVLTAERIPVTAELRVLVAVGFLGSYTTFSTFSAETWALAIEGRWLLALLNALGSVVAGFFGVWVGAMAARTV